jgi:hypothetical protein
MPTSRSLARQKFPQDVRVELLEDDLDTFDKRLLDAVGELRKLRMTLLGFIISLATATVVFAFAIVQGGTH